MKGYYFSKGCNFTKFTAILPPSKLLPGSFAINFRKVIPYMSRFFSKRTESRMVTHLDTELVTLFCVKYFSSEWKHNLK